MNVITHDKIFKVVGIKIVVLRRNFFEFLSKERKDENWGDRLPSPDHRETTNQQINRYTNNKEPLSHKEQRHEMLPPYRGGGSSKANDESDIDRTPEYNAFIADLADFHRKRGYISYLNE